MVDKELSKSQYFESWFEADRQMILGRLILINLNTSGRFVHSRICKTYLFKKGNQGIKAREQRYEGNRKVKLGEVK